MPNLFSTFGSALSQMTNFRFFRDERAYRRNENGRKLSKQVENTEGKEEIACYEQFLFYPQCFRWMCVVWERVKGMYDTVWERVKGMCYTVWERVKGMYYTVWERVKGMCYTIWERVKGMCYTVWERVKGMCYTVWERVKGMCYTAWERVKGMCYTVWERVKGMCYTVWERVKGMCYTQVLLNTRTNRYLRGFRILVSPTVHVFTYCFQSSLV